MTHEQRIIFLSYLTNYNINEIYHSYKFDNLNLYLEDWALRNQERNEGKVVEAALKLSNERMQEMIYNGIQFITIYNTQYPEQLRSIYQAPPILYTKGSFKQKSNIAIVGTRESTTYADVTIDNYIKSLDGRNGVVSGLALGIDSIAHKLALKHNVYTIAVMPNSLDHVYPKDNLRLANEIIQGDGCLVSELPTGINRGKKSFVERNRIQTGLSDFVAPIELGLKSGTMHTVDFCIKQERFLLIIPPTKEQSSLASYEGINYLMRKAYKKKIIIKSDFDLNNIMRNSGNIKNPTLF
jgi:DNA protecting protein DprA